MLDRAGDALIPFLAERTGLSSAKVEAYLEGSPMGAWETEALREAEEEFWALHGIAAERLRDEPEDDGG